MSITCAIMPPSDIYNTNYYECWVSEDCGNGTTGCPSWYQLYPPSGANITLNGSPTNIRTNYGQQQATVKNNSMGARFVIAEGTGEFNQTISIGNAEQLASDLKNYLNGLGWEITVLSITRPGLFDATLRFHIEAAVFNNFSAEQVRQGLIRDISAYQRWWAGGNFNVVTNLNITIISDPNTTTQGVTNNTAVNNPLNNPSQVPSNSQSPSFSNLFPSLGNGNLTQGLTQQLGITTPTLIAVGVILGVVLITRK